MVALDLRALIKKLDEPSKTVFHEAIGYCSSLTHYDLEIAHLLLKLMEASNSALSQLMTLLSLDRHAIQRDLVKALEHYPRGNAEVPAISPRIIELLRTAWLIGSVEYQQHAIVDVLFLLALYREPSLQQLLFSYSSAFRKIELFDLENHLKAMLANTSAATTSTEHLGRAASSEKALEKYTVDLVQQAKIGKIDAVIGRDDEIQQVIDILGRRRQNNPILTGEPGVGKTAIVEGLALLIAEGKVPEHLKPVSIKALDLGLLQAGAGVKGEFEHRLKTVIQEVQQSITPIILFIDEAHTMIGAGGQAGQADAANLLKPALARGDLRTIAATTWAEYKKYFEKDAALSRRFQTVIVDEPCEALALDMLRHVAQKLEQHHQVIILEEALVKATSLSHRYIPFRLLPDKSISVLDTACSRVALMQQAEPPALVKLKNQRNNITLEVTRLSLEQQQGFDHSAPIKNLQKQDEIYANNIIEIDEQWQRERDMVIEIKRLQDLVRQSTASVDDQKKLQSHLAHLKQIQGEKGLVYPFVDEHSVADVIASWTGIPVGKVLSDEIHNTLGLEKTLQTRVRGQDHALHLISKRVISAKAKLEDPNKPIAVFLLLGPSGIGKTETALALADVLYGGERNVTVLNMSEYKEAHKVSLLMGSPPGYVGYGEGGILTEAIRRKPYNLLLLDEMEKAHPSVQDIFYQVFDKGMLRDGDGRDVDFKNTIIIMTSNACSEKIMALQEQFAENPNPEEILGQIQGDLERYFKPAFLGRTTIIPYYGLNQDILTQITHLKLHKITERVAQHYHAKLVIKEGVVKNIVAQCQTTALGARQIDQVINNKILPRIAEETLKYLVDSQKIKQVTVERFDQAMVYIKITKEKERRREAMIA